MLWEEKTPSRRGRQVFLLASGNLEGLKVSKAREYQDCGGDWRIIGDAYNYGKKRLVGEVEACVSGKKRQLEIKETEDGGGGLNSHLPSFLNFPRLPRAGSKSLHSRAWELMIVRSLPKMLLPFFLQGRSIPDFSGVYPSITWLWRQVRFK